MKDLIKAIPGEVPIAKTRAQLEALARAHNIHPDYVDAPYAPRTEFEQHMHDVEVARLRDLAGHLRGEGVKAVEVLAARTEVLDLLGKHAWILKCLAEDVRDVSKMLTGEQRANATLALRHLEDAHHRMTLAQTSESTTVSSDKQKIENLARQCLRNAETIKDLRVALGEIKQIDGPGLDMSPGGPCYEIANRVLVK